MTASLMMYAHPALEAANARLWQDIRSALGVRGIGAPVDLTQSGDPFDVWQNPELMLSQTCGMPYRTRLHGTVQLVGTPDYALSGCPPGYYRSAVVVRRDDPRRALDAYSTGTMAYNMRDSQSGFAALYAHVMQSGGPWFTDTVASGGHQRSAQMVADGQADIAAIDAQTWRLIRRYAPYADRLRVLEYTAPTPGLPLITGPRYDPATIFDAVATAIETANPADRTALDLRGLVRIPAAAYLAVPTPPVTV